MNILTGINIVTMLCTTIFTSYQQNLCINSGLYVEKGISIEEKVINNDFGYFKENIKIPYIKSINKNNEAEKINKYIENNILPSIKEAEEVADEYFKGKNEKPYYPYEVRYDYKVTKNTEKVVSLSSDYYEYLGGAHGRTVRLSYTIDYNNVKILSLKDLFNLSYDYKKVINNEIERQIKVKSAQDEYFFFDNGANFKGVTENQDYYLEDNYLIIYFQEYELAPYAAGIVEFKIPISIFKGNFKYWMKYKDR